MRSDNLSTMRRSPLWLLLIGGLFFTTGACGLVYQVAWQRYLLNLFGATLYSISTVLAAFMGGLALGSILFGRMADRTGNPLRLYGALEIGVGLSALLIPTLLSMSEPIFVWAYRFWGANFLLYSLARFVFVFCVLLVPTTFMGGTLPLLSKFVAPYGDRAGNKIGLLYALNTCGAVAGTVASGFFFIRWWGVSATVHAAVAANIAAGLLALLLAYGVRELRFEQSVPRSGESHEPGFHLAQVRHLRQLIFATYFVSGMAALGLEVVWSRALVFTFELLKNTTYSFTAMLSVFLVGIALGSAAATPLVERDRSPLRTFYLLQMIIGLASIVSFFLLYTVAYHIGGTWTQLVDPASGAIHWTTTLLLVFLRSAVVVFPPTFFMGFAFPYAVRCIMLCSPPAEVGTNVGRLYALNTVGAILGSFLTGFVLLPALGIAATIWLFGTLQLGMGVALAWGTPATDRARRLVWAGIAVAIATISLARLPRPAIFQPLEPLEKLLFYKEGPLATVAVTENSLGYRTIFVDNVGVAGTEPMLLTDQKSLAHVPMLLLDRPRRVLTVGFGSGGASYSYTLHPELESIDCVEITKTVIEAAPTLTASNHDVVMQRDEYQRRTGRPPQGPPLWPDGGRSGWYKSDPRYRIILDDVRSYLRFTDVRYDVIATDCTDLRYKSNANLYDYQYFSLTRQKITDDGMVVVWMPLAGLSDEAFRVALRTFHRVFPHMEVFYMNNEPTHYILLLGTKQPLRVDLARMRRKLQNEKVAADLRELHLDCAEKILSCFVCGRQALDNFLAGNVLNTEDFPYLEFESPRFGYGDAPILMNLESLFRIREHPLELVDPKTLSEADRVSLQRYFDAAPAIIEGHKHYRRLEIVEAARAWLKALEMNPADRAVANLLRFEELRRKISGQPGNLWARLTLAEVLLLQGKELEAIPLLRDVVTAAQMQASEAGADAFYRKACGTLAELYERRNKPSEATRYREQARQGLGRSPAGRGPQ